MLKRSVITCAVALSLGIGLRAGAQQNPTQDPQATAKPSSTTGTMVHFEGCVFPERALSSDKPVVVPSGSVEDYILTHTKIIAGSNPKTDGIFTLDHVEQDRLRDLIGKRVGVTGRIDEESERPEFRVTSIREIVGTCPRTPSPRS